MDGTDVDSAAAGRGDPGRLAAVEAEIAELADAVGALSATVRRISVAVAAGRAPAGAGPVDGEELVAWVGWLVERYGLDLPGCWPLHGALVEELDALRVGWLDTVGAGQGGMAAVHWHDGLDRALTRVEGRWSTCVDGDHRVRTLPEWLEGGPEGVDGIDLVEDRYVGDDHRGFDGTGGAARAGGQV